MQYDTLKANVVCFLCPVNHESYIRAKTLSKNTREGGVKLESFWMSTLCVSFLLNSISTYIMCVRLYLFSALRRRVAALQISRIN